MRRGKGPTHGRRHDWYGGRHRLRTLRRRWVESETTENPTRLVIDGAPAHARRWGDVRMARRRTRYQRTRRRMKLRR
jgi:hypothetical protein